MAPTSEPIEIGIVLYGGAQRAAIYGLTDLFVEASRISGELSAGLPARSLRVTHWRTEPASGDVVRGFDTHDGQPSRPVVLIAPPTLEGPPRESRPLAAWMRDQFHAGATLCSICGGTFVLAHTGLLRGRRVTTHWAYAEEFARRFPDIEVDPDRLIIDDGDILTAGGMLAWTDVGLRLIGRFLGPAVTAATARYFLTDVARREQKSYSDFLPRLHHGDEAVLAVQRWLQTPPGQGATLTAMADQAGLNERTFLRRFRQATGLTPTAYVQRLRVEKARRLLEVSSLTIDQVAWEVGYGDPASFRKVFLRITGLRPGDYRRRFSAASSR